MRGKTVCTLNGPQPGSGNGITALPCAGTRLPGPFVYWPKVYREGYRHDQPINRDTVFLGSPELALIR